MEYKYGTTDKIIAYLTLISGLTISAVAVWYSVAGLVSIFAASAISITIMGFALEISKLVATVWLKWNWRRAPKLIKTYLISAIAILMLITSMGIFGFLSKAHLDQSLISGDVVDKVALLDEKIKTERTNIEAARKALAQMDAQVDQVLGRTTDDKGAERAVQIRRNQAKERTALQNEIAKSQAAITKLNEERAPIAKDLRQVEAEVGPIKYIAKLIYGDNPDANILEKAVTWVIIIIVLVFDPLAVVLLLASQHSFQWFRENKTEPKEEKELPKEQLMEEGLPEPEDTGYVHGPWPFPAKEIEKYKGVSGDLSSPERFGLVSKKVDDTTDKIEEANLVAVENPPELPVDEILETVEYNDEDLEVIDTAHEQEKLAMKQWKLDNPNDSLKHQRKLFDLKLIDKLPWDDYLKAQPDFTDVPADTYQQNSEQNTKTLWQKIKASKKDE